MVLLSLDIRTVPETLLFVFYGTTQRRHREADSGSETTERLIGRRNMSETTGSFTFTSASTLLLDSVARLGGFEFDCAGKYWLGRVDKIWAGFWSVWRFSKHINCIGLLVNKQAQVCIYSLPHASNQSSRRY